MNAMIDGPAVGFRGYAATSAVHDLGAAQLDHLEPPGFAGLVAGGWKIVDRFESDDRCYVIAQADPTCSPPCALAMRALTLAMRGHANKVIAIELGASQPTVTRLLARALATLRVPNMREAIALARTRPTWSCEGARDVFSWCLKRACWCDGADLSAAERDVVQRIADGASRAEIARARGTSLHTVHSQIASAFLKLGVGSKRELLQRASWVPGGESELDLQHESFSRVRSVPPHPHMAAR